MAPNKFNILLWLFAFTGFALNAAQSRLPVAVQQQLLLGQYAEVLTQLQALSDEGNGKASFVLGSLYAKGQGVNKDLKQAHRWLTVAKAQGNKDAGDLLTKLKYNDGNNKIRLLRAIRSGKYNVLTRYHKTGGDMSVVDTQGNSLLMLSIKHRQPGITRYLLNLKSTDLNRQNQQGQTALHLALENADKNLAQLLVNLKAKIQLKDKRGKTAWQLAKAKGIKLVSGEDKRKVRQSTMAQQLDNLLQQAKDKNSPYFGWPPLSIVVLQKRWPMVQSLIAQGHKPWMGQGQNQDNDAISVALKASQQDFALTQLKGLAAKPGEVKQSQLERWFELGLKLDSNAIVEAILTLWPQQHKSSVVLLNLIKNGRYDIAQMLIEHQFDVAGTDKLGRSALWYASDSGQAPLIEQLLEAKAAVEVADNQGVSPLMRAIVNNCYDCVALLLLYGSDIAEASDTGNNALMFAAAGKPQILALLLKNVTADKSALKLRNRESFTPLMLAVKSQSAECVVLLMAAGANPYRQNAQGQNAFDLAQQRPLLLKALNQS